MEKKMLAVVRVRGKANLRHDVKETFEHLNLHTKNWCVFLEDTPTIRGMIAKVKDYITWGEVTPEMVDEIFKKRGEAYMQREKDAKGVIEYNKFISHGGKKYKRFIRLSPPKKGYGQKGIKNSFSEGGALGNRNEKINDLLKRMI
jgi:large subunit ribosomal protein L30